MSMRLAALATTSAAVLAVGGAARAENRLAPIPRVEAVSTHGPYEMGACETCHLRHDANNPGAAVKVSNDLCYDCHDEFKGSATIKMESSVHPKTNATLCTGCHNPHNSKKKKLRL